MEQRQTLRFLMLASMGFLALMLLQPLFAPKRQQPDPAEAAKQQAQQPEQATEAKPKDAEPPAGPVTYSDDKPHRLVSLGSFGPETKDKMLVTFDSRGGAVRRIELNARFPNGKLRYYDQESRGAYLGSLDLSQHDRGCQIHFVGPGTPAHAAGLKEGDVLTAFDGKPIVGPTDFARLVDQTRIDQQVTLTYLRGDPSTSAESTCNVTMVQTPLAVIGPSLRGQPKKVYDPASKDLSSFVISLRKKAMDQTVWPELDPQMASVNWETREYTADGVALVEFSHEIPANVLHANGVAGPLKVIKRYWLPESTALDDFEKNFHVNMEVEIQNLSDAPAAACLDILGPTGSNIEGWWYQTKIHGRSSAIGYGAGARDVVAGSASSRFQFWGNAEIVHNFLSRQHRYQPLIAPSATGNSLHFICVDTLYFAIGMIPDAGLRRPGSDAAEGPSAEFVPYSAFPHVVDSELDIRANRSMQRTTDITFRLFSDEFALPPAGEADSNSNAVAEALDPANLLPSNDRASASNVYRQSFVLFAGPKEPALLRKYRVAPRNNIEEVVTYGWFAAFSKPLVLLLRFFYSIVHNYGLAIIMLTVIVRLLLMPISRKVAMNAQQSAKMMQTLQPEIKRLSEKYKDDLEKRMRAQQELFAKHGFNPIKQQFGGCLMVFLQLPIFIGLYRGLSVDVALRGQPLIPGLSWCSDLAAPDQLLYWKDWMPGFLGSETGWFGPYLNVLPLVTIVLFLIQTKLFMPPPTDEQQRFAQRVMTIMMIFMSVLFFKVPSGLCLYFITSSLWGMVERAFLPKPKPAAAESGQAAA